MKATAAFALMVALLAMMPGPRVSAQSPSTLTLRLYNTAGIPAAELLSARRAAEPILRDAGLDVVFRHCGRAVLPDRPADPCDTPLTASEVVVRIIDAPAFNTSLHPDAYGVTYVVRETNRGWLATVFPDRIDSAAARVGVEPGLLLGRVVAHEIGHLLLGNGYHGDGGVMRAEWADALLRLTDDAWRFSTPESARMRRALTSALHDPLASTAPPSIRF